MDISSGATCVADLNSGALALTKEASGNSRQTQNSGLRHTSFVLIFNLIPVQII